VLRFSGYRLMAQGVATSGENAFVTQRLAPADTIGYFMYDIMAEIGRIRVDPTATDTAGTVNLKVSLNKRGPNKEVDNVMSTGLDVPLGHTVVLGTAVGLTGGVAIILTVKPELVRLK
jgi:hypothetical protein